MDNVNFSDFLEKIGQFINRDLSWTPIEQALSQFHFIRPEYLWALPVFALLWLILSNLKSHTLWESYIAKDKLDALLVNSGKHSKGWRVWLILGWILGSLAMAGPTWKQTPVPTVRDESAMVIVLDLSRSMLAQDIAPNRLTRTKFKLIDILRQRSDGQTALVAYAGDPHTVSPLTDDARTIEALLPALDPGVMPIQGSNTESAIELSLQLLRDAGVPKGKILLLTDGVAPEAQRYIRDLYDGSFTLSILGIGSTDAVPIPNAAGGFFSDSRGEIILTRLNRDELQIMAGLTGGRYVELQPDDSDITYLLDNDITQASAFDNRSEENATVYDSWEDMGYWLILLLLPFVAFSFRKGALFSLPYILPLGLSGLFFIPNNAQALEWQDFWLTADQKGQKLMQQEEYEAAADTFKRDDLAAIAEFKANNYSAAVDRFSKSVENADPENRSRIENSYNLGNALAFDGKLEEAIAAYESVLEQDPQQEDALYNKQVIEQLLQQQESQEGESGNSDNQESGEQENQDQQGGDQQQNQDNQESGEQGQESQENQGNPDSDEQSEQQSGQESEESNESSEQQSDQAQPEENQQETRAGEPGEENAEESENEQTQAQQESQSESGSEEENGEQSEAYMVEATPDMLEDASEQWLRAIPDDPSGLLKRKFDYESRQNQLEQRYRIPSGNNADEERY